MADKFRQTFPIAVSFSEGELPTSSKLTGLATQARSGQNIMQYALGDLWNQGGDLLLGNDTDMAENAMMIPNLARYLGAAKHSNPAIPALPDIEEYSFKFSDYSGEYEARLTFPLASGAADPTWTGSGGQPSTRMASRGEVVATGQYYIDDSGNFYSYDPINVNWVCTYEPDVSSTVGDDTTWNVIPDPATDNAYGFLGVKIRYKNSVDNADGYYIYLPPRQPRYNSGAADRPRWYPDPDNNMSTSPTTEKLFWQGAAATVPDETNPTYAEHYRYTLPTAITGSSEWAAGVSLPAGMLYLWDEFNTGTIIEGVTFQALPASPNKWALYVPAGTPLDDWLAGAYGTTYYPTAAKQSALHTPTYYPSQGLKLITVGSDISQLLKSLLEQFLKHDHSSANSTVSRPVPHGKLSGHFAPGSSPQLDASQWDQDDHPQYFHRRGYSTGRDKFGNSILGDILMASTNSGSNYINSDADSRKIHFGTTGGNYGARVYFDNSQGRIVIHGRDSGSSTGGMMLGDPTVSTTASWVFKVWNNDLSIYPYSNNSNTDLFIDAYDVRIGTDYGITRNVVIGNYGANFHNLNCYLRAGNHIDIACGEGNVPSVSLYDDAITIRAGAGIDIRTQGGNGGTAGDDDIVISAGSDVWVYADSSIRFSRGLRLMSWSTVYKAIPITRWMTDKDLNERWMTPYNDIRYWVSPNGATIPYSWFCMNDYPVNAKIDGLRVEVQCDTRDELTFWVYYGNYWWSLSSSIGYYHLNYPSGGWQNFKISCGGQQLGANTCVWLRTRHQDDNTSAGGPDGYAYIYGMCELEFRVLSISSYVSW